MTQTTHTIERRLADWLCTRLPHSTAQLVMFVAKQGWACLFRAVMLTAFFDHRRNMAAPDWPIARYDALLIFAITVQLTFLAFKLETLSEAKVILLFHLSDGVMKLMACRCSQASCTPLSAAILRR